MINKWSEQVLIKDLEHVKDGENLFVDDRGIISNHELTEPINLIGMIESKKGTIRANHYHPQQEQKCLFTKGQIIEIFQDILDVKKGTVNLNSTSSDIDEWDSVATVNIIVALEDEFGIKFKLEGIQEVKSVKDFVELVQEHKK